MQLVIKQLDLDLPLPRYQTSCSSGMDLHAATGGVLQPHQYTLVPTGIAMAVPIGYEGQIRPRSGLAAKYGVTILNSPGTIDADYRGEIKAILYNAGTGLFRWDRGDRIAQLVIARIQDVNIVLNPELSTTARGENGFGSTGYAC